MDFLTNILVNHHNKKAFDCGNSMLNNYFHNQANQDIKRNLAACFVLTEYDFVKGYYTLSNASIPLEIVPENIRKKLPKSYANLPATLLGRLAVDKNYFGQGIGKLLLLDALKRSYLTSINSIASIAVIVDPIDDYAIKFYDKYGFVMLPDSQKMFLPMKTVAELF